MHWSGHFAAKPAPATLSTPVADPFSGQPELKHVPVRIAREAIAWAGVLITRRDLRPTGFVHWSRRRVDGGWVYELAGAETPDQGILLARSAARRLPARPAARISRPARPDLPRGRPRRERRAGRGAAGRRRPASCRRATGCCRCSPRASRCRPPTAGRCSPAARRSRCPSIGRIVCSCFNVGVNQIAAAVAAGCATRRGDRRGS